MLKILPIWNLTLQFRWIFESQICQNFDFAQFELGKNVQICPLLRPKCQILWKLDLLHYQNLHLIWKRTFHIWVTVNRVGNTEITKISTDKKRETITYTGLAEEACIRSTFCITSFVDWPLNCPESSKGMTRRLTRLRLALMMLLIQYKLL